MTQKENIHRLYQWLHLDSHIMIVGQYDIVILRDDHSTQILGWKEILLQHPIAYPTKTQVLYLSVHLLHLLPDIIAECFICRNRFRIKYTVWKIIDRAEHHFAIRQLIIRSLHQWHKILIFLYRQRIGIDIIYAILLMV